MIGVCDFDFLSTKKLCYYNYGVLLVNSYYKLQGVKVRLILNLDYNNLSKYKKIYIFKDYKTNILPINMINNYYSLPIEEFGDGFENRPSLPDLKDIYYLKPNIDVYKPIISYIKSNPSCGFIIDKNFPKEDFIPCKLFLEKDNEILLLNNKVYKKMLIYDDPLLLFNTEVGRERMTEIIENGIIKFVKPTRIGLIEPEFYSFIFKGNRLRDCKEKLFSYEDDKYLKDAIDYCSNQDTKGKINIIIKTTEGIIYFKKIGGKIYGEFKNARLEEIKQRRAYKNLTKKNISVRSEWFATKRYSKSNRPNRDRASEQKRRKYLPSEYAKRRNEMRRIKNLTRTSK